MDTDGWLEGLRRGSGWVIAPARSRTAHGGAVAVGGHMGQAGVGDMVIVLDASSRHKRVRGRGAACAPRLERARASARVIALDFVFAA